MAKAIRLEHKTLWHFIYILKRRKYNDRVNANVNRIIAIDKPSACSA
jgi:hypothetical protein